MIDVVFTFSVSRRFFRGSDDKTENRGSNKNCLLVLDCGFRVQTETFLPVHVVQSYGRRALAVAGFASRTDAMTRPNLTYTKVETSRSVLAIITEFQLHYVSSAQYKHQPIYLLQA